MEYSDAFKFETKLVLVLLNSKSYNTENSFFHQSYYPLTERRLSLGRLRLFTVQGGETLIT